MASVLLLVMVGAAVKVLALWQVLVLGLEESFFVSANQNENQNI